ncbi:hypothetical protein APTCPA18_CDS90 [Pseudomonas phage APTC-PA18]|nr:hypothetical protein APTCPA18_CDS90 [Pseudomonas phage APTC-PA18]
MKSIAIAPLIAPPWKSIRFILCRLRVWRDCSVSPDLCRWSLGD